MKAAAAFGLLVPARLMRPALLRLLKRPSALFTLDSLAAAPVGLEQLESRFKQLRCHSRRAGRGLVDDDADCTSEKHGTVPERQTARKRRPLSFPVYEIEHSPATPAPKSPYHANHSNRDDPIKSTITELQLDPEKLDFESDIGHANDTGTRLVDRPEYQNNIELWEELLRFRQRHYGDGGTLEIWTGLTVRLEDARLPVTGRRADYIWRSFVELGLKRELLLQEMVDYAIRLRQREGEHWAPLYETVVGGLLDRGMSKQAINYHQKLQQSRIALPRDITRIIRPAISSASLAAETQWHLSTSPGPHLQSATTRLKTLKSLCRKPSEEGIYGLMISALLVQGYGEEAIVMHEFLTGRHDHPETIQDMQSLLDYAKKYGSRDEFQNLRDYASQRFGVAALPSEEELLSTNNTSHMKLKSTSNEKSFRDDIGARLFATRAINFEMILGSLKMLGVSAIGARSLRELATRANNSQEVLGKIKALRFSGISITDSVFTRLVQKLSAQNRDILLSDLLRSDQHPDSLEDVRVQESLLVSYYVARDWRQYNMSLAILAELCPDADLSDLHFRKHITAGELSAAAKVADEMALHGRVLSEDSMDYMAERVLAPRRMGHRPPPIQGWSTRDQVMFIFKILQRMVPIGGYVSSAFWVEMLKRLGMELHHWKELRECCNWLVRQYARSPETTSRPWEALPPPEKAKSGPDGRMLSLIFTSEMQAAIVYWGFQLGITSETESKYTIPHPTTGDQLIPWVRGILLLRELEQAGLHLQPRVIRDATRHRLAVLFGKYSPSARPINRTLRRNNPYSRQRVLKDISSAWGESMFAGAEYSHTDQVVNPVRSPGSLRRSAKVVLSRKRPR